MKRQRMAFRLRAERRRLGKTQDVELSSDHSRLPYSLEVLTKVTLRGTSGVVWCALRSIKVRKTTAQWMEQVSRKFGGTTEMIQS